MRGHRRAIVGFITAGATAVGVLAAGSLSTAAAAPGNPVWIYDYGVSGVTPAPAIPNATTMGPASLGRIQVGTTTDAEWFTDVGERSRNVALASAVTATATDGTRDFLVRSGSGSVEQRTATGSAPTVWNLGLSTDLTALAVSAADPYYGEEIVWVGDDLNKRIGGFNPVSGSVPAIPARVGHVTALAVAPDGTILVLDGPDGYVQRVTSQGIAVGRFGSAGSGDGQFTGATGITVDAAGTVFVADTGNGRVEMFSATGSYLGQFGSRVGYADGVALAPGEFVLPTSVAVDCLGTLHVLDVIDTGHGIYGRVSAFAGVAAPTGGCAPSPSTTSFAGTARAMPAVDPAGNVYLATDTAITKYDAAGHRITSWSSPASGDGHWASATALTVAPNGEVYLVDANTPKILEFHAAGRFVRSFTAVSGVPDSIAVRASDGHLFVVSALDVLEEYLPDGTPVAPVPIQAVDGHGASPLGVAVAGDKLLVTAATSNGEAAIERFKLSDASYLDQFRAPGRHAGDDEAWSARAYPGGGYALLGAPAAAPNSYQSQYTGLLRLNASGVLVSRLLESTIPAGHMGGLTTDCVGRLVLTDYVTGKVYRLNTSTSACHWLPTATTGGVASRTATSLTVKAASNPSSQVTKLRVQYGTTTAYGHATAWITLPSDNVVLSRNVVISGLTQATGYHYRVQVSNASGAVNGADRTATTS